MNPERQTFFQMDRLPGRLSAKQAAWLLGFEPHEIPILLGGRLLKPLGHPPDKGMKFFLRAELERLQDDPLWMGKASDAVVKFWKSQNERRRK
jgi:hypothetical protein